MISNLSKHIEEAGLFKGSMGKICFPKYEQECTYIAQKIEC